MNQVKTDKTRMGYPVNLVSLSLLTDFTNDFFTKGVTMRGFYKGYESTCIMKWGMDPTQVISWNKWHAACVDFWNNILTIDDKKSFVCVDCGPRPNVLVLDGIAMGLQISELKKNCENLKTQTPFQSLKTFESSKYEDRMFIRKPANRKILKEAAQNCAWPELPQNQSESDSDFQLGGKRKRTDIDIGMDLFVKMLMKINKLSPPSKGFVQLMANLSTSTSTVGIFQVIDEQLLDDLKQYLKGDQNYNFVKGTNNIAMHQKMRTQYPAFLNIIINLAGDQGMIERPAR